MMRQQCCSSMSTHMRSRCLQRFVPTGAACLQAHSVNNRPNINMRLVLALNLCG
jgi:hypothetical protein